MTFKELFSYIWEIFETVCVIYFIANAIIPYFKNRRK